MDENQNTNQPGGVTPPSDQPGQTEPSPNQPASEPTPSPQVSPDSAGTTSWGTASQASSEKCTTCGNQASNGTCVSCGQGELNCTCTPAGGSSGTPSGGESTGVPPAM